MIHQAKKRISGSIAITIILYFNAWGTVLPPNDAIDVKHYNFQLELYDSTDVISGTATIQILFKKDLTTFELDLVNKDSKGAGMTVSDVTLNGKSLQFDHQQDKLKITLPEISHVGDLKRVVVSYKGIPRDGLIIGKNKFGDRTFFGDNWPERARHWLPTIDHPSDKASVDFIVTAPTAYYVIGNGIKVEESYVNARQKLTHWREEIDIPTKVMVIAAARFAIHLEGNVSGIPVESWVYPQNRLDGFHDYAGAVNILEYFHNHIGPYPYNKLANVQAKIPFGGMENASNIFYFENSVNGKADQQDLIAHEIAHQWFGNSASETDWHHVWLSEGFATYFSRLYAEFADGQRLMDSLLKVDRGHVIDFYKTTPQPIVYTELPKDLMKIPNANSYHKGSWVLHMLRNEIGDDAFWKGIRKYYRTYQYGNAQTSDFIKIMEETSGQDLNNFFKQWLFTAGHPVLDMIWKYDSKAKTLNLIINQTHSGPPFEFTLELGIYTSSSIHPTIAKLKINKETTNLSFPFGTKPTRIELDPNTNLLFDGKLRN
ncbi:MAG TPA: M1 family metallopeptidase [Chryseolinea sp.]